MQNETIMLISDNSSNVTFLGNVNTTSTMGASELPDTDPVLLTLKVLQIFVGLSGNILSLIVLSLYRHYLSHPFWFYLVAMCSVDFIGCLIYIIELDEPLDFYHTILFKGGHINADFERWVINMVGDLSAWLIVFIAVERWKNVCWKTSSRRSRHLSTTEKSSSPPAVGGIFGLASLKRRTAQLETCFVVGGALMILNASVYFCDVSLNNATKESGRTAVQFMADKWTKAWPFLNATKKCFLPALILLALNGWIVVYTIKFLWFSPSIALRRRFQLRRLTQSSISTQQTQVNQMAQSQPAFSPGNDNQNDHNNSAEYVHLPTSDNPQQPTPLQMWQLSPHSDEQSLLQQQRTEEALRRTRARRRRRLVFAWLTLLALPTVFIILTVPRSTFKLLCNNGIGCDWISGSVYVTFESYLVFLERCNHTVNCCIYCLTIAKFRTALHRLFSSICRDFHRFVKCFRSRPNSADENYDDGQCQLVSIIERARKLHRIHSNKNKRRFVVGVQENVEALSDFQHHHRQIQLGIRRVQAMESGIAFNSNDHFYED